MFDPKIELTKTMNRYMEISKISLHRTGRERGAIDSSKALGKVMIGQ
jgi:hypothetical protein